MLDSVKSIVLTLPNSVIAITVIWTEKRHASLAHSLGSATAMCCSFPGSKSFNNYFVHQIFCGDIFLVSSAANRHSILVSVVFFTDSIGTSGGSKGGRKGRAPPPLDPIFFIFMQFSEKNGQIIGWRPPFGVGAPPSGKSWIRHWGRFKNLTNYTLKMNKSLLSMSSMLNKSCLIVLVLTELVASGTHRFCLHSECTCVSIKVTIVSLLLCQL